jgi:hypothetical protein
MLTRREARMIAEELYVLMNKDKESAEDKRVIGAVEAARMIGWSLRTLYNRISDIPHEGGVVEGKRKRLRFTVGGIKQFIATKDL